MQNLTISPNVNVLPRLNKANGNVTQNKNVTFAGEKQEAKTEKWTTRNYIDAATVGAYATLLPFAKFLGHKNPDLQWAYGKIDNKKQQKVLNEAKDFSLKTMQGKYPEGGKLFKAFRWCGNLAKNNRELTNNKVYGFGTLFVMPLVILFSPIGKKDATPEDRFFTVLRQPISFATVYAMQKTFDKIFKSLTNDMNLYGLLDGMKDKKGEEIVFSKKRSKEMLNEILSGNNKNGKTNEVFSLTSDLIDKNNDLKMQRLKETFSDSLKIHLFGDMQNKFEKGKVKYSAPIEEVGNKFTKDQFIDLIYNAVEKMGIEPDKAEKIVQEAAQGRTLALNEKSRTKLENLLEYIKPATEQFPELEKCVKNISHASIRTRGLKELSSIICNSMFSQALGIMMLNFLYGKMMKRYGEFKQKVGNEAIAKQPQAKMGGVQ